MKYIIFLSFFFIYSLSFGKYYQQGIDTVYSFKPGTGQNDGQDSLHFPMNIFGLPDTNASIDVPASSPYQVCSIGLGGEIVVGFKGLVLMNGEGPDFTIFENVFLNPANNKFFVEPAKVSVSQDGINFISFPFDSLSLVGCAGTKPTNGKNNPFDYKTSGGNSFDIADLSLSFIKYIKITDITQMLFDNKNHPFYDPILSGFDLDAVVGMYLSKKETLSVGDESENFEIFTSQNTLSILSNDYINQSFELFNIIGERIFYSNNSNNSNIRVNLDSGLYLLKITLNNHLQIRKVLIN